MALSGPDCLPSDWPFKAALKGDHVQDGFTILSLLDDHNERNTTLVVPHTGDQANRFTDAIKARNARMKLYGQNEVAHRCQKCTRVYKDQDGKVSIPCTGHGNVISVADSALKTVWVAVMDGVTLGHPCCASHNCKIPLTTSRDRFCVTHRSLSSICAIKDCGTTVVEGKKTCGNPTHQEVERLYILRGESRVQLQEKLKRQRVSHPNDGVAEEVDIGELIDDDEEEEFELAVDELDPALAYGVNEAISDLRGASPLPTVGAMGGKKRLSARFGRKRTHNEQILVAPCGIILARDTQGGGGTWKRDQHSLFFFRSPG